MNRLLGNYPKLEDDRLRGATANYLELYCEIGHERFVAGVNKIIREGGYSFFPSLAEFRGYLPDNPSSRAFCGNCNEGWLYTTDSVGESAVRPCECRPRPNVMQENAAQARRML
jgi:hypothetical protein